MADGNNEVIFFIQPSIDFNSRTLNAWFKYFSYCIII